MSWSNPLQRYSRPLAINYGLWVIVTVSHRLNVSNLKLIYYHFHVFLIVFFLIWYFCCFFFVFKFSKVVCFLSFWNLNEWKFCVFLAQIKILLIFFSFVFKSYLPICRCNFNIPIEEDFFLFSYFYTKKRKKIFVGWANKNIIENQNFVQKQRHNKQLFL